MSPGRPRLWGADGTDPLEIGTARIVLGAVLVIAVARSTGFGGGMGPAASRAAGPALIIGGRECR